MKLPITTYEIDHYPVTIDLFVDADNMSIRPQDIVAAINKAAPSDLEERLTCAIKAAFELSGRTKRHYSRDDVAEYLLPALEAANLKLVDIYK